MSLILDWHQQHKERVKRLWAKPTRPKTRISITEIKPVVEPIPIRHIVEVTPEEWVLYSQPISKNVSTVSKLKQIRQEISNKYLIAEEDIISRDRTAKVCEARFEFCYRAVTETTASLPRIANCIGREHSTIIHAVATYCNNNNLPFPRDAKWPKWKKS